MRGKCVGVEAAEHGLGCSNEHNRRERYTEVPVDVICRTLSNTLVPRLRRGPAAESDMHRHKNRHGKPECSHGNQDDKPVVVVGLVGAKEQEVKD